MADPIVQETTSAVDFMRRRRRQAMMEEEEEEDRKKRKPAAESFPAPVPSRPVDPPTPPPGAWNIMQQMAARGRRPSFDAGGNVRAFRSRPGAPHSERDSMIALTPMNDSTRGRKSGLTYPEAWDTFFEGPPPRPIPSLSSGIPTDAAAMAAEMPQVRVVGGNYGTKIPGLDRIDPMSMPDPSVAATPPVLGNPEDYWDRLKGQSAISRAPVAEARQYASAGREKMEQIKRNGSQGQF